MYLKFLLFLILILSFPGSVYANAGIPMIAIAWPVLWLSFLPIILIERFVLEKKLKNLDSKLLTRIVIKANFFSTLIGIPFAWLGMLLIQFCAPGGGSTYPNLNNFWKYFLSVTLQAPWLIPYEQHLSWMVPAAFIILLVPFFLISYKIEAWVVLRSLSSHNMDQKLIKESVWKANIYSYLFLGTLAILFLMFVLFSKGRFLI